MTKLIIILFLLPSLAFSQSQRLFFGKGNYQASVSSGIPQNLFIWSEDMTNAAWGGVVGNTTVTANAGNDLTGANTMNEINCTFGASNTLGQTITVSAGDSIYIEFDVYKPASGAVTDVTYQFYDLTHFVNLANPSYFSSVTTSVQRLSFSIVVPSGCTQLICRPFGDGSTTGKILIGRCQIKQFYSRTYVTTTTTPVL